MVIVAKEANETALVCLSFLSVSIGLLTKLLTNFHGNRGKGMVLDNKPLITF